MKPSCLQIGPYLKAFVQAVFYKMLLSPVLIDKIADFYSIISKTNECPIFYYACNSAQSICFRMARSEKQVTVFKIWKIVQRYVQSHKSLCLAYLPDDVTQSSSSDTCAIYNKYNVNRVTCFINFLRQWAT